MESLVKRDRAAVVCDRCLACRVRMRKPGEKIWLLPRYRSRRRRSLCAQCPAQYTAGKAVENGRTTVPSPAERRDLICKGVILWTMPVGAASVTALGPYHTRTQSL